MLVRNKSSVCNPHWCARLLNVERMTGAALALPRGTTMMLINTFSVRGERGTRSVRVWASLGGRRCAVEKCVRTHNQSFVSYNNYDLLLLL